MDEQPGRPVDVDTGFGLWLVALILLVIGYGVDVALAPNLSLRVVAYAATALFLVVLSVLVATFLLLMRQGYRWARTLLTGAGVASVIYVVTSLFTVPRATVAAVIYAVTAIVGSVLIAGGAVLLHRKDARVHFTR